MPQLERTVVLIKPDAVQRGFVGESIHRFARKGLTRAARKMTQIADEI